MIGAILDYSSRKKKADYRGQKHDKLKCLCPSEIPNITIAGRKKIKEKREDKKEKQNKSCKPEIFSHIRTFRFIASIERCRGKKQIHPDILTDCTKVLTVGKHIHHSGIPEMPKRDSKNHRHHPKSFSCIGGTYREKGKNDHSEETCHQSHYEDSIGGLLSYDREKYGIFLIHKNRGLKIIFHKVQFRKNLYTNLLSISIERYGNTNLLIPYHMPF